MTKGCDPSDDKRYAPRKPKWSINSSTIIERIHARGALIKVLDKPPLDLTTPIGRGSIAFLSALAEDERQRILKRANDGRKATKARGARFGRKQKLSEHQQAEALKRLAAGESCRQIGGRSMSTARPFLGVNPRKQN